MTATYRESERVGDPRNTQSSSGAAGASFCCSSVLINVSMRAEAAAGLSIQRSIGWSMYLLRAMFSSAARFTSQPLPSSKVAEFLTVMSPHRTRFSAVGSSSLDAASVSLFPPFVAKSVSVQVPTSLFDMFAPIQDLTSAAKRRRSSLDFAAIPAACVLAAKLLACMEMISARTPMRAVTTTDTRLTQNCAISKPDGPDSRASAIRSSWHDIRNSLQSMFGTLPAVAS